jgi:chitinase
MDLDRSSAGYGNPAALVLEAPDISAWERDAEPSHLGEPPSPRLSPGRVVAAVLIVLLGFGAAGYALFGRTTSTSAGTTATPTYAPYVDVTLTPTYAFEDPTANPVGDVVLGFVVASAATSSCTPSWGGAYSLGQAGSTLDLDRRIEQMVKQGGHAMVSFGGQANTELAVSCTDTESLTTAYGSVVDRYKLRTIDFDIEGAALADTAANDRRAAAVAALQKSLAAQHRSLRVWLTLPVATSGFTPEGQAAISSMLRAGVRLAGVNAMAMDFEPTAAVKADMLAATTQSLTAAHAQLESVTDAAGVHESSAALWARLGVTVMIGRNDIEGEVFSLADARGLTKFVRTHRLSRLSIWSINRDAQCGSAFAQLSVLSNTCSGVKQPSLAFTKIFMRLPGTKTADSQALRAAAIPQVVASPPDDPATSPYPIWKSGVAYGAAYKVVWHHNVYQAKWYTQDQSPDGPSTQSSQSPWLLLGPVRATDKPMRLIADVKAARLPPWDRSAVYRAGDRVSYAGLPFQARWYIKATVPDASLPADPNSPWKPLFRAAAEPHNANGAD